MKMPLKVISNVSDNEYINKLWAVGKFWKKQLNAIYKKDENYWMDKSGINILNKATIEPAKQKLTAVLTNLKNLREASGGCMDMIRVMNFTDHMDIKGWGSMFVSTKVFDIEARKQASREFNDCIEMIDKAMPALNKALAFFQKA